MGQNNSKDSQHFSAGVPSTESVLAITFGVLLLLAIVCPSAFAEDRAVNSGIAKSGINNTIGNLNRGIETRRDQIGQLDQQIGALEQRIANEIANGKQNNLHNAHVIDMLRSEKEKAEEEKERLQNEIQDMERQIAALREVEPNPVAQGGTKSSGSGGGKGKGGSQQPQPQPQSQQSGNEDGGQQPEITQNDETPLGETAQTDPVSADTEDSNGIDDLLNQLRDSNPPTSEISSLEIPDFEVPELPPAEQPVSTEQPTETEPTQVTTQPRTSVPRASGTATRTNPNARFTSNDFAGFEGTLRPGGQGFGSSSSGGNPIATGESTFVGESFGRRRFRAHQLGTRGASGSGSFGGASGSGGFGFGFGGATGGTVGVNFSPKTISFGSSPGKGRGLSARPKRQLSASMTRFMGRNHTRVGGSTRYKKNRIVLTNTRGLVSQSNLSRLLNKDNKQGKSQWLGKDTTNIFTGSQKRKRKNSKR